MPGNCEESRSFADNMGVQVVEQILLIHSAGYHSQYFQIYLEEKLLQRCDASFSFVVKIVFFKLHKCVCH